ncbi:MAG: GAF domain-containing sensor histidine kinase [Chloroflexi bacterium]|nr:GAF domain-containing sensor histidine kinase [Chloroflexota bacterium]
MREDMTTDGKTRGVPARDDRTSATATAARARAARARFSDTLEKLSETIAALTSERSIGRVLQRIVDLARDTIGTRYAALGVADAEGRIQQFSTSGLTPQERAAIGPLPRGHGLLGVLIHEGRPVRIPDISQDPRSSGFPPNHPVMKTLLGVPIVLNGRVLGDLYLTDRLDGAPFDEDDERLARLLARHAAVAIDNAQTNDELERRLEQLSSLRAFGQAIGGELDVERALQLVVERASDMLGVSLVAIALKESNSDIYTFEAASGRRARRLLGMRISGAATMLGWVAAQKHAEILDDVAHDDRVSLRVLEAVGGQSGLWAPLLAGERVVGCLMAMDPMGGRSFGQADVRLAEAIGQQAAVAIDNARLYERARQEASTSRALLLVTRAMNASIRLEEILQLIVDSLAELIGTPAVAVYLLGADGTGFELAATRALAMQGPGVGSGRSRQNGQGDRQTQDAYTGVDAAGSAASAPTSPGARLGVGATDGPSVRGGRLATLVAVGDGPSVIADTRDRPDLSFPTLRDGTTPRSVAVSPIQLGERILGVVEAYSTVPNHFSEDDTALLAAFADQAATAIETARLFGQARELALLQERDRIAKELHDGIIQTIYAVGLNLDYCRLALREDPDDVQARLGDATAGLNRAIQDIRNYILDLTHRVGGGVNLREAAEGLAREYSRSIAGAAPRRLDIRVDVDDEAATILPAERRAEIVQVMREALANAIRHGQASDVTISAQIENSRLAVRVIDNGLGFEPGETIEQGHHGLRNMANRARMLDGQLKVTSAPGQGTTVQLLVPLAAA